MKKEETNYWNCCARCGKKGVVLNYNNSLCKKCTKELRAIYGYKYAPKFKGGFVS